MKRIANEFLKTETRSLTWRKNMDTPFLWAFLWWLPPKTTRLDEMSVVGVTRVVGITLLISLSAIDMTMILP